MLKGTTLTIPRTADIDIVLHSLSDQEIDRFIRCSQPVSFDMSLPISHQEEGDVEASEDKAEENEEEFILVKITEDVSFHEETASQEPELAEGITVSEMIGGDKVKGMEVDMVDNQNDINQIREDFSECSIPANTDLVKAILESIGELPGLEDTVEEPVMLRRYAMRVPILDGDFNGFNTVVDERRITDVVKAVNQEKIAEIIRKCSQAEPIISPFDKPFMPLDDSVEYLEALKKGTSSSAGSNTVPLKRRKSKKLEVSHRTKCRYCNSNLRAIDKYRDDGLFALECRNRECLRFNGFTDDQALIVSLKRPKSEYGWYLSNPMRIFYGIRPNDGTSDDDEPPPRKPPVDGQPIMVRCPGQKRLCMLV